MADIQNDLPGPEGAHEGGGDAAECDEFGRLKSLLAWKPLELDKLTPKQIAACHELFRRGDISFFLHPEQKKLLDWIDEKKRDIAVVCICRQFGKTTMMLAYCMAYCIRNPRASVLFVAPFATQLDKYLLPKMQVLFGYMPDDLIPTRRGLSWSFPNGSILRADGVSIGKAVRLRGDSAHLVVLDEVRDMTDLQPMVESTIVPLLTTTNGNIVMISTPPESPMHSFTDKYIREAIATDNFYTATYKENPMLSTKQLRSWMQTIYKGGEANITFRREMMADYSVADADKRVVREWDEEANDKYFETYAGPPNPVRMYTGMDYGFADPCGLVMGYYDHREGVLIIEDEHFQRNMNTDDVGMKIIELENRLRNRLPGVSDTIRVMDIDPALMADLYRRYQLRFEPAYKVPSVLTMLNRLRTSILDGRIKVRKNCVNLRFQLRAGVFNSKGTEFARTEKGGHLDLVSALIYLNLNLRWNDLLARAPSSNEPVVGANQMYLGPFASRSPSFSQGVISRPR